MGWIISGLSADAQRMFRLEAVLVGTAGAALGGLVIGDIVWSSTATSDFSIGKLALATAGASILLFLLFRFKKAVGPLRPHKQRSRHRFYD
ncbi:GlsB/YeaQ/YmgE family stress response membrane protein [Variovorax sp. VNK109]|uniref:GlsB/YeaQ/YmgE family stress response membrane protein n=1 Tax=Variovorax sp. VNK109 TaxID=3400919 RepID=UPI003C0F7464